MNIKLALLFAQIASAFNTQYPVYKTSYMSFTNSPSPSSLARPVQSNMTVPKPGPLPLPVDRLKK